MTSTHGSVEEAKVWAEQNGGLKLPMSQVGGGVRPRRDGHDNCVEASLHLYVASERLIGAKIWRESYLKDRSGKPNPHVGIMHVHLQCSSARRRRLTPPWRG